MLGTRQWGCKTPERKLRESRQTQGHTLHQRGSALYSLRAKLALRFASR